MPISDVLKGMRDSSYGEDEKSEPEGGERVLELTPEEAESLKPYQEKFGNDEMVTEVTGRLEGNSFKVSSVKYAESGGKKDVNADAEEVMSKYRNSVPMVQTQTVPSPS